jgi:hypothetical protein
MTQLNYRTSSLTMTDKLARGLGMASIALGAVELAFPGAIARALGLSGKENLLRACGAREIASGLGMLQPNPGPALWARAGGDLMDLATLATAKGDQRRAARGAMIAVGLITALDVALAAAVTAQSARPSAPARDYSDRSGLPNGVEASRGVARDYAAAREARARPPALAPEDARLL